MTMGIEYEDGEAGHAVPLNGAKPGPRDFHHPYKPYDIQVEFMDALYGCLQEGKVGIFESPTGTGKSLSLLCSSLTWLRDQDKYELVNQGLPEDQDEPEWVRNQARDARRREFYDRRRQLEEHLAAVRKREAKAKERYESGESFQKRRKLDGRAEKSNEAAEDQFMLDEYYSDDEGRGSKAASNGNDVLSATTIELMAKLGMIIKDEAEVLEYPDSTKIFYCSRTHSQLIQLAGEVRRIKIPLETSTEGGSADTMSPDVKHLALGSRKNLCINQDVRKLNSATAINEKCMELQQSKTGKGSKCSYLPNKENEPLVHNFRDHTLAKVRDIEDLAALGKRLGICPYYASRAAIKPSEIVTLPYPLMLQKSAREALEISLKDHVIIIDEAHNLMDAISGIYSVSVSLSQLQRAKSQLLIYLQKFKNKLKGKNRVYVTQVVRMIDSLVLFLTNTAQKSGKPDGIANVSDLTSGKGADQINLFKLSRYLLESKLARKVDGYLKFSAEDEKGYENTPALTQVDGFFYALTNPAAEGRFFYSKTEDGDLCLKYLLLDPMPHFRDIVQEARSVILAGGTMSPMEDYVNHLFPYIDPGRLKMLSCGHVIPPENLIAWPVCRGPDGTSFEFTFEKRGLPKTIDALGECLISLAQTIPDGFVVFFPSYAYLDQVAKRWKTDSKKTWERLERVKPLFLESRTSSADDVISQYSDAIAKSGSRGALLFSVVGGKMSEGINFSDQLGRGVAIVGLPFPNAQGAEWKARMSYVEQAAVARGASAAQGKAAAREFYENACMRAVNQSIGRAIRHRADYATIVMLDARYATPRIQEKLPGWIKNGTVKNAAGKQFREVVASVQEFFSRKSKDQ